MIKKFIILIALLIIASALCAQPHLEYGTVTGTVTMSSGVAAVGAQVIISPLFPEFPHFAYTDSNGAYSIDSVLVGHHEAEVVFLDAETEARIEVEPNETIIVDFILEGSLDETGSVAGNVLFLDQNPVSGAIVHLDGGNPHHGHEGIHLVTIADSMGTFFFSPVPVGPYEITAVRPMVAWVSDNIQVEEDQTTNVTLFMRVHEDTSETHHHDSLTIIELTGRAIVFPEDPLHHHLPRYFVDVNGDSIPDYRLSFGPLWYNPPSGAHRPNNHDLITIRGGLLTYTDPPVVVVYDINGLMWRPTNGGHGGNGGTYAYQRNTCSGSAELSNVESQQNPTLFQATGFVEIPNCVPIPQNPNGVFLFRDIRTQELYNLNFGTDWDGIPGNATNPISVVGGYVDSPEQARPWVIVYELDAQLVREPGDTVRLASPGDAVDPIYEGTPSTYLTANNYPNPFNPVTTINYSIPIASHVKVTIFDLTGREVSEIVNSNQMAGTYNVEWNGSHLSSGIYFYRISAGNLIYINRMVLLK